MNLASVDLNLLVALDALLAEAHVGRAARRIGLSQPAASHALRRLRHLFSDQLLVRAGARMELTPRAIGLREEVADALERVRALLASHPFDPAASSRNFSLMMPDHVAPLIVPALVNRTRREAPGVTLHVLPWRSPASLAADQLRAIDLLISCSPDETPGFRKERLFADTEVTAVRRGYRSPARLRNLEAFLGAAHVAVAGSGMLEDPVDAWLRQHGVARRIVLRAPGYLQALQAAAGADLLAFVPRRLAESLRRPFSLVLVRPPIDPGHYLEHVLYPARSAEEPATIWLKTLVLDIGKRYDRPVGRRTGPMPC